MFLQDTWALYRLKKETDVRAKRIQDLVGQELAMTTPELLPAWQARWSAKASTVYGVVDLLGEYLARLEGQYSSLQRRRVALVAGAASLADDLQDDAGISGLDLFSQRLESADQQVLLFYALDGLLQSSVPASFKRRFGPIIEGYNQSQLATKEFSSLSLEQIAAFRYAGGGYTTLLAQGCSFLRLSLLLSRFRMFMVRTVLLSRLSIMLVHSSLYWMICMMRVRMLLLVRRLWLRRVQ